MLNAISESKHVSKAKYEMRVNQLISIENMKMAHIHRKLYIMKKVINGLLSALRLTYLWPALACGSSWRIGG